MTLDLWTTLPAPPSPAAPRRETLSEGAILLRGFAESSADSLIAAVLEIAAASPFRIMKTPSGLAMSASMTNAGPLGWVSDAAGYRYRERDPESDRPWPAIPEIFFELARSAAAEAGYPDFVPDACLVNRYVPGARMGLHQDKDERDFAHPIVSVSLGLPIVFLWGGPTRKDRPAKVPLVHGDVVVFGGAARRFFHGVAPLAEGNHPLTGAARINLTFRKAR